MGPRRENIGFPLCPQLWESDTFLAVPLLRIPQQQEVLILGQTALLFRPKWLDHRAYCKQKETRRGRPH